jgi:hypothetical protein
MKAKDRLEHEDGSKDLEKVRAFAQAGLYAISIIKEPERPQMVSAAN